MRAQSADGETQKKKRVNRVTRLYVRSGFGRVSFRIGTAPRVLLCRNLKDRPEVI
jgi:predicted MPP superfamily phosphohydrolase